MKSNVLSTVLIVLLTAATAALVLRVREMQALRAENATLRAELQTAGESQSSSVEAEAKRVQELTQLRTEAQDLARLRGEVTQLRAASKDAERLRAENQRLQAQNQQLRASPVPAAPAAAPERPVADFPREAWSFAGYGTPESALVSAIWAMREGNPKTYFDSLSPEEQARMAKVWENKSETDVAAKHQSDVAKITSIRVVDRQESSPNDVTMSVYIGGVDRLEKVQMKKVGNDWKFGGFIREPKQ